MLRGSVHLVGLLLLLLAAVSGSQQQQQQQQPQPQQLAQPEQQQQQPQQQLQLPSSAQIRQEAENLQPSLPAIQLLNTTTTSTTTNSPTTTTTTTTTAATTTTTSTTTTTTAPKPVNIPQATEVKPISDSQALPRGASELEPSVEPKPIPQAVVQEINSTTSTSLYPSLPAADLNQPSVPLVGPIKTPEILDINSTTTSNITTPITNVTTNATSEISSSEKPTLLVGIKTIIDLSYPLEDKTLHWPKNYGFKYLNDYDGEKTNERNETYYVKSDGINMAVHTGTHLDAPRHFGKSGWTVDKIPLERLIDVPIQVIDLSHVVEFNRSYEFTRQDFIDQKTNKSLVQPNSVVLVYTGISKSYYEGEKAYFGGDTSDIAEMRIPGFSGDAARYLVEMGVYGVGLDAPSADSSKRHGSNGSFDPVAHAIFNTNNIYILENINNRLAELVNRGEQASLTAAPLAIAGGSGSPVRLVAVMLHNDCSMALNSGVSILPTYKSISTIATILITVFMAILMS